MKKISRFLIIFISMTFIISGCAKKKHRSTLRVKSPETMSKIDTRIALADCMKKGLIKRKAVLSKKSSAGKGAFPNKATKAQFDTTDHCLKGKGFKIKRRNY